MVSGDLDNKDRAELLDNFKQQEDAITDQMKQLLGDNYSKLQEYEGGLPDRVRLANLKDQLAAESIPLGSQQEKQLTEAIREVKRTFKFADDFSDESKIKADPESYLSGEKWQTLLQDAERFKQLYLTSAKGVLSTEQFASFEKFITKVLDAQLAEKQMSMKLAVSLHKEAQQK